MLRPIDGEEEGIPRYGCFCLSRGFGGGATYYCSISLINATAGRVIINFRDPFDVY